MSFAKITALICLFASSSYALEANGGNSSEQRSPYFNGSFLELSARSGVVARSSDDFSGYTIDLGIRHAFPMMLADTRLAYQHLGATRGESDLFGAHQLHLSLAFHPLYLVLLGNDLKSQFISSFYVDAGLGIQWSATRNVPTRIEHTNLSPIFSLGGGLDIPLWNPDVGHAPWLNINYRYQFNQMEFVPDAARWSAMHNLIIGLGWRFNGVWL